MTEPSTTPGSADIEPLAGSRLLRLSGDWTLAHYSRLRLRVAELGNIGNAEVNLAQLGKLDTAGAALLLDLLGAERLKQLAPALPVASRALLRTLHFSLQDFCKEEKMPERHVGLELLARIGKTVDIFWQDTLKLLGFIGLILETLARNLSRPRRWRMTALILHIEQTGLNAAPIVALLTFMVGAVVAFLGATVLATFGATIFTVDLVAFAFLREFAVLLTAILMAGRTASAFTAQIGSMQANEEIDAIRTLGLDPIELLVLPRVLALLISLPMLTFIGMLAGISGGAVVCAVVLDISPTRFLGLVQNDIGIQHFLVGMLKAPVFAFLIAAIGCLEGLKVTGSAASVGAHTTSSVVQSIFVVILLDAVAALFFMEIGY